MSTIARRAGLALAVVVSTLSVSWGVSAPASAAETTEHEIAPGGSKTITQSVETQFLPPMPDVVLVIDRTGSMGPAVTNVKQKIANMVATIQTLRPAARFAVVAYCEQGEEPFRLARQLSGNATSVIDSVINLPLCHGGDLPEAQMDALWRVANGGVAFRPDSNRIIAWFGDAPGHAVSGGHNEAGVTRSLQKIRAKVVAVSVGRDQLDAYGQARRITRATGGTLTRGVSSGGLASSLLAGITSLEVRVTAEPSCQAGLDVKLAPREQVVASGKSAKFTEKITVAATAPPGTLKCTIPFTIEGRTSPVLKQEIVVTVPEPGEEPPGDIIEAVDVPITVTQDSVATEVDVLAEVENPEGVALTVASVSDPANGIAALTEGADAVTYTPDPGYCNDGPDGVPDTFTYTLDPGGSEAEVAVTVTCADDGTPTVTDPPTVTESPTESESLSESQSASESSPPPPADSSPPPASQSASESASLSDDPTPNGPDPTP